jgi:hypothetical protein
MPRNRATSLLALLSLTIVAAARPPAATSRLADRFEEDVRMLAADELGGVAARNRANPKGRETNLFLARWMD